MVGPNGLEPSTSSVSRKRSNQLSYGPINGDATSATCRGPAHSDSLEISESGLQLPLLHSTDAFSRLANEDNKHERH